MSLWNAVSLVPDGIMAIGSRFGMSHPLREPATHTVPPRRTSCSESTAVLAPTRSRTWSGPSGQIARTLAASAPPVSRSAWSTPTAVNASILSGRRVVAATSTPWPVAIEAAANPTDDVPPRISNRPATGPNASSAPCAVRYVSGSAARTSHANVVVTGISRAFGSNAYSA